MPNRLRKNPLPGLILTRLTRQNDLSQPAIARGP